ncbi:MAG: type II secretion system F family protein [Candidatus Latescibacterota bacterium]
MPGHALAVIAVAVFAAVLLGALSLYLYLRARPGRLERRLGEIRHGEAGGEGPSAAALAGYGLALQGKPLRGAQARLVQAGYWSPRALLYYRCVQGALAVVLLIAALQARAWFELGPRGSALAMAGAVLLGFAVPSLWLDDATSRRRQGIRAAIPNVLDLLIVCVEAGLGLNAAIQRVSKEMRTTYPELSRELTILDQEIFLGKGRGEAFRNMARRTGVDELRSLATVLMQSDRMGTSIAQVLRVQAATIREKRRQMALELAHKMPTKLVFPLVLFIFPELLVVLLGPGGLELYRTLADTAH